MAELHTQYSTTTTEDILYGLYLHTQDVGSAVNLGDDGGTDLVFNGSTWGGTPANATFFATVGAKIVIQGVHPNAEKWWLEVRYVSATSVAFASGFDGVYTTGGGFSGTSVAAASHTLSPDAGDHTRYSSSTEDTYNAGSSVVNYFRLLFFDASVGNHDYGIYAGNFIPTDETEGKPFLFMYGIPNAGNSTSEWGRVASGAGDSWSDLAHSGTTFAGIFIHASTTNGINTHPQDFNGNFITGRCFIHVAYANIVGYLGDNAFRSVSETAIADGTAIVGGGYFANQGYLHRWLP